MGAYQGLYMGGVPDYAAVSETVAGVRRQKGKRLAGVANAVLRKVIGDGDGSALFPDPATDPVGHLVTWGSHPRWLLERWTDHHGVDAVRDWVAQANRVPPVYVRPFRGSVEEAADRLRSGGFEIRDVDSSSCGIELGKGSDVRGALELIEGFVQDPAAARVAEFARPEPGIRVADLCAAPGGKSLALAAAGHPVVASDPSEARLLRLRESIVRLGADAVTLLRARAEAPPLRDLPAVLLDVPCSGTGTLARNPDIRWRLTPERIASLVELQARILDGAAACVAVGGLLVYATCSMEADENEEQVRRFLVRHPDYRLDGTPPPADGPATEPGILRLTPDQAGYDGAFAARLRRVR